ncbi:hypothetical protein [Ottowia sp.]|jgi:hypothetical protein|uniref:hypothetical protein n=1 Tax=Ottowia sp. TaxID=1898956 RepID=UPI0025D16B0C|nr:hypothetical protein [Ottowia sp.]MBK6615858.1 hypothetical protein [Ottowia sp.]MBK6746906.1 hypothetical protein [Ottowia sp.]
MGLHLAPRPAANVVHLADHAVPSYRRPRPALGRPGPTPSHGGAWAAMARQRAAERAVSPAAPPRPVLAAAVRVTRVPDAAPGAAGRLRVSGRLIDVCAELERLAEGVER